MEWSVPSKVRTKLGIVFNQNLGVDHNWREALDPETKQLYYYNTETKQVQWDRPKEMGAAPYATGWYGRGVAGSNAQLELDRKNQEYLNRPAPKQAETLATNNIAYKEGSQDYNIWYGKFAGDTWNSDQSFEPADARCNVALHSGSYTEMQIFSKLFYRVHQR